VKPLQLTMRRMSKSKTKEEAVTGTGFRTDETVAVSKKSGGGVPH